MSDDSKSLEPQTALLFQKFVAEQLNEDEAAALLRAFDANPELQDELFQQVLLDDRLHEILSPRLPLMPEIADIFTETPAISEAKVQILQKSSHTSSRRPLIPAWILFLFLFALLGWGSFHELRPFFASKTLSAKSPEPTYLGRVTAVAETRWSDTTVPWSEGRRFESEKIVLESGSIELTLKNGVRIVLEGPAEYHQQSLEKSFCTYGRLSAEVPPAGHGFEIATPTMTVRDLGTEFVVDVAEQGSEVHVVKGAVETHWLTKDWLPLSEGRGLNVRPGEPVRQIVAEPERFVSRKQMEQKAFEYADGRHRDWRTIFERDGDDLNLVFRLDFDSLVGRPVGVQSVPGRWRGEKAVEFHDKNDRVETDVDGTFSALTLLAAIRLDGFDRACNTILATDLFSDRDGFCWSIENSGRLQLQYMEPDSRTARLYESETCFSSKLFGVWIDLAVTIDTRQRKVVHYMNGRPVAKLTMKTASPIPLGRLTIGNWTRQTRTPVGRQFQGRIDSLTIFSRILSEQEIRERTFE